MTVRRIATASEYAWTFIKDLNRTAAGCRPL
ncbi:hypothetical protein JOF53_006450 [Crossiella equi]|uniref:Transposase n=1 Tax=Crossiella equi TaxID=130796 RepID=A0ABS5ALZ4_9PSEU|nr:hypothetical protein [Crossiella equi]